MAKWNIDSDHSVAGFEVRHMKVATVRGQFNTIKGTLDFDPDNPARSSVEATIDISGLTTGNKTRDDHLRSPDFLDVERYPAMTFRSTAVEITGTNRFKLLGDLTIHGITRPVTMDVEFFGPLKAPFGGETTMGFAATAAISRFDFKVKWNELMEDGGLIAGKEVRIMLDLEADMVEE